MSEAGNASRDKVISETELKRSTECLLTVSNCSWVGPEMAEVFLSYHFGPCDFSFGSRTGVGSG